jgi:hypothetical protein
VGNEKKFPLVMECGVEGATLFGGTTYCNGVPTKHNANLSDFFNAAIPATSEQQDKTLYTAEGDQLGSLLGSLTYHFKNWKLRAYYDHYFEDGSGVFFLDYDGYGKGAEWNDRVKNRYIVYDPKDGLFGLEVTLPKNRLVSNIVGEYLYTKYQSGPIYIDHDKNISDHIGGTDNYMNHAIYSGWQHWGQVIGNPLYLSPIYNSDGEIYVKDNRFVAWHFGISGDPAKDFHYRMLITTQKGWGTYGKPFADIEKNFSLMAEVTYIIPHKIADGWCVKGAFALDRGKLLGDNTGVQVTIIKTGIIK